MLDKDGNKVRRCYRCGNYKKELSEAHKNKRGNWECKPRCMPRVYGDTPR